MAITSRKEFSMADFSKQQINALIIILASYLLLLLDASIVITGLPEIQSDLGFSSVTLSWVQNAYTLCFGSLLLVGARAGDLLGRRRVYLFAVALFALSSLVIGLAQSPGMMIAARAVQGMSAAVLAPSTLSLLSLYFKEGEERVKALSLYGATAGIGATLGLVLGGVFAGWFSWRVGFRGATWMLAFGVLTLVAGNLPVLFKRVKRKSVTP
jgi:MFS family permease